MKTIALLSLMGLAMAAGPGNRGEQAERWQPADIADDVMDDNAFPTIPTLSSTT